MKNIKKFNENFESFSNSDDDLIDDNGVKMKIFEDEENEDFIILKGYVV